MTRTTWLLRFAALGAATLLAVLVARLVLGRLRPSPDLVLVDSRSGIEALLAESEVDPDFTWPEPVELGRRLAAGAEGLGPKELSLFFPSLDRGSDLAVPYVLYRWKPHWNQWKPYPEHPAGGYRIRTNDRGLREDEDVRPSGVDLRILVMGDSHIDGVCANRENLAHVLERSLAATEPGLVDVLNVGRGAYGPLNYLGAWKAYADLEPDALVLVFFGGNDFQGSVSLTRHLLHLGPGPPESPEPPGSSGSEGGSRLARAWTLHERGLAHVLGQELAQACFFADRPGEEELALRVAVAVAAELDRQCREGGAHLLVAYLPPPSRGAPSFEARRLRDLVQELGIEPAVLEVGDRLAAGFLAAMRELGIANIDLTPTLADCRERPYWETDWHLNVVGHAAAAAAVEVALRDLLGL